MLDSDKHIDQTKLDLVARLGGDWYARIREANLFKVEKPNTKLGIGFDHLPAAIMTSDLLTNNEKAQLANFDILPESNLQQKSNLTEATVFKIKLALANQETALAWEIIRTSI